MYYEFLSTPSARRATVEGDTDEDALIHFYPRPPRGGRPGTAAHGPRSHNFYPRPPRGGRLASTAGSLTTSDFYPRPPRGGRPRVVAVVADPDLFLSTPSARRATREIAAKLAEAIFLSTPSARRATREERLRANLSQISIHALREEGDPRRAPASCCRHDFYPRPPRGGRHRAPGHRPSWKEFLSTPSARRATRH